MVWKDGCKPISNSIKSQFDNLRTGPKHLRCPGLGWSFTPRRRSRKRPNDATPRTTRAPSKIFGEGRSGGPLFTERGLPLSLQLVGHPFAEAMLYIASRNAMLRGGRQKQPRGSQRDANPTHRASAKHVPALATGKTRQELYLACPNDRPNHIGIAVQRLIRAGRIQERDGKLYATSPAAHATA